MKWAVMVDILRRWGQCMMEEGVIIIGEAKDRAREKWCEIFLKKGVVGIRNERYWIKYYSTYSSFL